MAGKVNSTTNDIKKYEWNGYHKQGSIEDENFLNLSEKLEKIQQSTDSQTSTLSSAIKNVNNTCKELGDICQTLDTDICSCLKEIMSAISDYSTIFAEIITCLKDINISINGGSE